MRLIVGLGNPGAAYEATWHNLGFGVIDVLARRASVRRFRAEAQAEVAQADIASEKVLLVKPLTYMNLSGVAVRSLLDKYAAPVEPDTNGPGMVVCSDDLALPLGMIRVRAGGSAGGQKGLQSIIDRVGSQQFPRVRLGIRPGHQIGELSDFVLSRIPGSLSRDAEEMTESAADAVELIVSRGVEEAMRTFNQRIREAD